MQHIIPSASATNLCASDTILLTIPGSRGSAKVQHPFAKAETKSGDVLDEEGEDQLDMGHSHKEGTSHSKSASISGGSEDEDLTAGETSMSKSGSKSSKHADTDSSETSAKTGGKSDGKYDIVAADEDFAEDTSTSKSGSKVGFDALVICTSIRRACLVYPFCW